MYCLVLFRCRSSTTWMLKVHISLISIFEKYLFLDFLVNSKMKWVTSPNAAYFSFAQICKGSYVPRTHHFTSILWLSIYERKKLKICQIGWKRILWDPPLWSVAQGLLWRCFWEISWTIAKVVEEPVWNPPLWTVASLRCRHRSRRPEASGINLNLTSLSCWRATSDVLENPRM